MFAEPIPPEAQLIPIALLTSFLRLLAAYILALVVAIPLAATVALNERLSDWILGLAKVMPALPGTALYPLLLAFLLARGFSQPLEYVSVFVLFSTMIWYIFFPVAGAMRHLPRELKESVRAYSPSSSFFIRRLLLPGSFPALVTGSLAAWGGGWNALVVSEYGVFNERTYKVTGIGSLLDVAAYEQGSAVLMFLVLGTIILTIVLLNRLVWQRLYTLSSRRFSLEVE